MFNVGDKIVYPMHGAGRIDAIEEKNILGENQSYYILKMPGEVKVMVPIDKAEQIGVRNIIDKEEAGKVMSKVSLKHLKAPCVLYNLNGYYNDLKALLNHMIEKGLSSNERQEGIYFAENLDDRKRILGRACGLQE